MNAAPEVSPLHINLDTNDFFHRWPESRVRLTLIRGLLVSALSLVAAYQSNANPTSGSATGAANGLKTDHAGFCADGMKDRRADDIDPTVFFIVKGRLYVCTSPEAEKEFRSHEQENTKKADQNWDEEYRWFY